MGVPKHKPVDGPTAGDESLGELVRRLETLTCDGAIPEPATTLNIEHLLRLLGEKVSEGSD